MNHNLIFLIAELGPVEGRLIVAATQICHHELRPAAAATRHLAAPKEHRHVTHPPSAGCRCNSL